MFSKYIFAKKEKRINVLLWAVCLVVRCALFSIMSGRSKWDNREGYRPFNSAPVKVTSSPNLHSIPSLSLSLSLWQARPGKRASEDHSYHLMMLQQRNRSAIREREKEVSNTHSQAAEEAG